MQTSNLPSLQYTLNYLPLPMKTKLTYFLHFQSVYAYSLFPFLII